MSDERKAEFWCNSCGNVAVSDPEGYCAVCAPWVPGAKMSPPPERSASDSRATEPTTCIHAKFMDSPLGACGDCRLSAVVAERDALRRELVELRKSHNALFVENAKLGAPTAPPAAPVPSEP